ncbi:MAG: hypothetical protein R2822_10940 [Spirosomataceae bacterium]
MSRECASVLIDLVGTTLIEAQEKLEWATENLTKSVGRCHLSMKLTTSL